MNTLLTLLLGGKSAFDRTFRNNEFAAISHRGGGNTLLWLSLIVGATIAALAFGVGSLQQLDQRMNNPFTNIVDMGIYSGDRPRFNRSREGVLQEGKEMGLDTITSWARYPLNFLPRDTRLSDEIDDFSIRNGRTVDYNSALFNFIFIEDNIIQGETFRGDDPDASNIRPEGGVIMRASALEDLGYQPEEFSDIITLTVYKNKIDRVYQIPLLAVVKDLPSNADFVTSFDYYSSIVSNDCSQPSITSNDKVGANNVFFLVPHENTKTFHQKVRQLLPDSAGLEIDTYPLKTDGIRELDKVQLIVELTFADQYPEYFNKLLQGLQEDQQDLLWLQYAEYNRMPCESPNVQYVSFLFERLDEIKRFDSLLLQRTNIDIPTEVAENKENFALVSLLGRSIGIILLLFSVASICFFIRNLIEGHLNEVKPNLGTFKAFGLPDGTLVRHYRRILLVLLLLAVFIGIFIALILGGLTLLSLGPGHYSLLNYPVTGSIALIFLFSVLFSGAIIRKILSKSPGDLVYGRNAL